MRTMNNKPPLQQVSAYGQIPSPPSPPMCFPSPKHQHDKQRDGNGAGGGGGNGGGGSSGGSSSSSSGSGVGLCGCQRAPKSLCMGSVGVILMVLLYTALGSITFMYLEGEMAEDQSTVETAVAASKPYPRTDLKNDDIRSRTVERLWSITEDLNILYKDNWTRLASHEVQQFQDKLLRAVRTSKIQQTGSQPPVSTHKWSYASAFLYSITLITTIGYGGVAPRTQWGRIAALSYALVGIPIVLLYLSVIGEGLSGAMRCMFRRVRTGDSSGSKLAAENGGGGSNGGSLNEKRGSGGFHAAAKLNGGMAYGGRDHHNNLHHNNHHHNSHHLQHHHSSSGSGGHTPTVPISICVMILICYVMLGAVLFHKIQHWGVLESLYFCFTSLGTIGFGDLAPQGNVALCAASAYILVGMAVVAMCFSLIQTELIVFFRRFGVNDVPLPTPSEDVSLVSVAVTPKS